MSPTISPEVEQPRIVAPLKWPRSSPTSSLACISDLAPKTNTILRRPTSRVGRFGSHPSPRDHLYCAVFMGCFLPTPRRPCHSSEDLNPGIAHRAATLAPEMTYGPNCE